MTTPPTIVTLFSTKASILLSQKIDTPPPKDDPIINIRRGCKLMTSCLTPHVKLLYCHDAVPPPPLNASWIIESAAHCNDLAVTITPQ